MYRLLPSHGLIFYDGQNGLPKCYGFDNNQGKRPISRKTHLPDPSFDVNRPPATPVPLEDEGVTKRTDDTDESSAGPGNNSISPDRDIKKASLEYMLSAL